MIGDYFVKLNMQIMTVLGLKKQVMPHRTFLKYLIAASGRRFPNLDAHLLHCLIVLSQVTLPFALQSESILEDLLVCMYYSIKTYQHESPNLQSRNLECS